MNLLLLSKQQVEAKLGGQGLFENNLLGMTTDGEKTYAWLTGDMTSGWKIIIGFFGDKARYVAFQKRSNSKWEPQDTKSSLSMIGLWKFWASKPEEDTFDYEEIKDGATVATASAWRGNGRRYAFAYVADVEGGLTISPVRSAIDPKFPGGGD